MDLLTASKPAAPRVVQPTIRIHVPLHPEETVNVNFTALAEAKYGWDALHPVASRLRALHRHESDEESDSDMQDVTAEARDGQAAAQTTHLTQPKKRKRRKMNEYETYDIDDPFIDDDELTLQELTAVSKDGFFVFQGPLVGEGDKVRIEKADGSQRRGNGHSGSGGSAAAKRSNHARNKSKAASTPATVSTPAAVIEQASSAGTPASPLLTKQPNGKAQPGLAPAANLNEKATTQSAPTTAPASQKATDPPATPASSKQAAVQSPTAAPGSPVASSGDMTPGADANATRKPIKPRTDDQKRQMRENAARRRAQKKEETRLEVLRRALRNPTLDTAELQAAMAVAGGEANIALSEVIKLTNRALGIAEHSAAATTEAKLKELDNERKAPPLNMESIAEQAKRVAATFMETYLSGAHEGQQGSADTGSAATSPPSSSAMDAELLTGKAVSKAKVLIRSPERSFAKPVTPGKAKNASNVATSGSPSGRSMSLVALLE